MKKIRLKFTMALILLLSIAFSTQSCSNDDSTNLNSTEIQVKRNEATSKATGFYSYTVKRYVFLRTSGAPSPIGPLGHVGVAFEVRTFDGTDLIAIQYYVGSVENTQASPIVFPGGNNGGWWSTTTSGAQLFSIMRNRGYDKYKFQQAPSFVNNQTITLGYNKLINFPNRGYNLSGNNCMNATYDVLVNLGSTVNVSWPSVPSNYFPTNWYNSLSVPNGWSNSNSL